MASIILQDPDSNLWQVQIVVVAGPPAYPEFQSTPIAAGVVNVIVLVAPGGNHYQLAVDLSGNLTAIRTLAPGINGYVLGSSDCSTGWLITVIPDGNIDLNQITPWNSGPQVGTLFPVDFTAAVYTQPGGPGTTVYPQQAQGEMMGLFNAGCGHFFNSWLVQCAAVCGVPSAIVGCPLCGYVVQIITPFSLIYTYEYAYILG